MPGATQDQETWWWATILLFLRAYIYIWIPYLVLKPEPMFKAKWLYPCWWPVALVMVVSLLWVTVLVSDAGSSVVYSLSGGVLGLHLLISGWCEPFLLLYGPIILLTKFKSWLRYFWLRGQLFLWRGALPLLHPFAHASLLVFTILSCLFSSYS